MRIGSLARSQNNFMALFATAAAALLPLATFGQSRYAPAPNQGPMQALYNAPAEGTMAAPSSRYVDAYGNPLILPASYAQQCGCQVGPYDNCGPYGGASMAQGDFNGPCPMGAGGTDPPIGEELMCDTGIEGDLVDQRGPHYFDVRAEAVALRRNETFGRNIDFTALNVGNDVVLSSSQLSFNMEPGFRIIGRYDICPLSVVEFGYMGIFSYSASASATDPNGNLFSLFSIDTTPGSPTFGQFGTSPPTVNTPGGPNPEFERALKQSISLESDLQTAEISYRRYWLGYIPRISGTLLAGFRYTHVGEEFEFRSIGSDPPQGELAVGGLYRERTVNNLAGAQAGGDIWISLMQGLRFGTEGKVGLYDNHSHLRTKITTTPQGTEPPSLFEEFEGDTPAFIGEASIDLVADVFPSISIRGGYEVLFLDQLALAGDNFNTTSPYGNQGTREPFFDRHGDLFYYGVHLGIEYIW